MNEENRNYDEIQSKTVLLEDNDGVNDMLSALNTGRAAMDKKKKDIQRKKLIKQIVIAAIGSIIALLIVYFLIK